MAAVDIVFEHDIQVWCLTLYSYEHLPVSLFDWLRSDHLRPSNPAILRLELNKVGEEKAKRGKSQRLQSASDLDKASSHTGWIVCRITGSYSERPCPGKIFEYCFGKSNIATGLGLRSKDSEMGMESYRLHKTRSRRHSITTSPFSRPSAPKPSYNELLLKLCQENCNWIRAGEMFQEQPEEANSYSHEFLQKLSKTCDIYGGHWTAYFREEEGKQADIAWHRLIRGFLIGNLCSATKICCKKSQDVITVTASCPLTSTITTGNPMEDFVVFRLEKEIRISGILRMLKFKPDVYSAVGINHNSQKLLRPTVYKNQFDDDSMSSRTNTNYTEDYDSAVCFPEDLEWTSNFALCNLSRAEFISLDAHFRKKLFRNIPPTHLKKCGKCRRRIAFTD